MKLFLIFIIIFSIIIYLIELDRNRYSPETFYNYYINDSPKSLIYGFYNSLFKLINNKYIYDINKFKFYHSFKKKIKKIKKELIESNYINLSSYAHNDNTKLNKDNNYKIIKIKFFNKFYFEKEFKTIHKLCKKHINIRSCFFSILNSRKIIPYHVGPYCGLLRCHIPIIINKDHDSHMIINNIKINCSDPFIFDDTYVHKLEKLDDYLRIVLIIDIDHPNKLFIHDIISYIYFN